jgi:hypothetical protein
LPHDLLVSCSLFILSFSIEVLNAIVAIKT